MPVIGFVVWACGYGLEVKCLLGGMVMRVCEQEEGGEDGFSSGGVGGVYLVGFEVPEE